MWLGMNEALFKVVGACWKFLSVEGRINTLMDIIPQLNIEFDKLTHESQKLYEEVVKKAATEA